MSSALVARLREEAPRINNAAVARKYREDPFWWARYGERGLRYSTEDGMHHFNYVAEAVAAGDPNVMVEYARWLRSVLVARGMCSEHLADAFRLRADLVAAENWPDAAPAIAAFVAGAEALRRDSGVAGALETLVPPLLETLPEARHLVSYLVDSLALGDSAIFVAHVAWRRGQAGDPIEARLGKLRAELERLGAERVALRVVDAALHGGAGASRP